MTLLKLLADGYAAVVLGRGDKSKALAAAKAAFEGDADLMAEARTETARLEAMGPQLERRCFISAKNREFLQSALKKE